MKLPSIPLDKANHMIYGFLIYVLANCYLTALVSLTIVVIIAILKEIYDKVSKRGTPEVLDVLCTIILPLTLYLIY